MRRRPVLASAAAIAAFLIFAPAGARAADYVPGQVIVKYRGHAPRLVRAIVQRRTGTRLARVMPGGARVLSVRRDRSVPETIASLRRHRNVEWAVPDYIAHADAFYPNDPGLATTPTGWTQVQWDLVGPFGVDAPDAWAEVAAAGAPGGRGVTVAVLDTGLAYENRGRFRKAPDLARNHITHGYDFVDNDTHPDDLNGHGTHVSMTIAESTNNGIALTGLAYGVKIMPLRVLDSEGAGDAVAISRAIRYAADHGAKVINMSLEFDTSVTASQIPEIVSAVRHAHAKGVVLVAAAGNEADTAVAYPAHTVHVISVGATTQDGCQADYSNGGPGLKLMAPGRRFRRAQRRQRGGRGQLPPRRRRAADLPADLRARRRRAQLRDPRPRVRGHVDGEPARGGIRGAAHREQAAGERPDAERGRAAARADGPRPRAAGV